MGREARREGVGEGVDLGVGELPARPRAGGRKVDGDLAGHAARDALEDLVQKLRSALARGAHVGIEGLGPLRRGNHRGLIGMIWRLL